ncbi:MAG: tRNA-dihydrouridine synthase [candidate division TM6 bacterium GW2011_GWF2_38_10]|nr:MAG: tRNA-dihydrouridine synthase [candidate division TM6 bacterium GW2011_GWF2_38_10]
MNNTSFWQETISIGGQAAVSRFMTAPLDGVIDSPMRQMIRLFSPNELMFSEMRHVDTVANEKEGRSLIYAPCEQPLVFQFSANRINFIPKAVERVLAAGFKAINLNSACPAPAVVRSGSGSALMGNIPQLTIILNELQKSIAGRVPLSIKIRAGFKEKNALTVAQLAQDVGCEAVIIHPRTQPERFSGRLDFDLVAAIKKSISIPVIYSGNITKFEVAQRIHSLTGADGFMIGRALWGAPWKLKEIVSASQNIPFSAGLSTAFDCIVKHLDLNAQFYGPYGYGHFKKHLAYYIRTFPNAANWRTLLLRSQSEEEMRTILNALLHEARESNLWLPL